MSAGTQAPLVLVVDDTPLARMILRQLLERRGYRVVEAGSTEEALRSYQIERPDVVTMDILMDRLDGIVAIQLLRRIDPTAKVVVCSATSDPAYVAAAAKLGVLGYLTKPIDAERLASAIEKALSAAAG